MSAWFVWSYIKQRNDVADIAWGLGFILLTWTSFFLADANGTRPWLSSILVSIWGLRLAVHIYQRNRGKAEDYRYLEWRRAWGNWFYVRSYLQVYLLQGGLLFLIALPLLLINQRPGGELGWLDYVAVGVWLLGFSFEVIGDAQLTRFIKDENNKGRLLTSGLWRYSRHPNYFGEVSQWWGIGLLALSSPGGWLGLIGPLTITILILKVSGIPLLEKKMQAHPEFPAYRYQTSVFIPWWPRVRR